jgi:hypothetical protein
MRRSANLSAEKLVGDYLGRVLHAAQRVLPKGDRLLFVARTRAAIMKKVGPLAAADPAKVLEILTDLGDPRTMAKNELERLETAHRGGPPKPVGLWKPVKDEWKPTKADTEPIPRQPPAPPSAAQRPAGARPAGARPAGARPPAPPSAGPSPAGPPSAAQRPAAPQPAAAQPAGPRPAGPRPAGPQSAGPQSAGPSPAGPPSPVPPPAGPSSPGYPSDGYPLDGYPSDGQRPAGRRPPGTPAGLSPPSGSVEAGDDQPGGNSPPVAPAPAPPTVLMLARSHPLETVAIVLLGVGGLIIPLLWLPGALVALVSRVWDARDKWLALLGTPVFLFVGLLAAGVLVGGRHGFFGEFIHAFDAYREYLLRAGAVLSAVYLAWRIRRGPRMRSLPPWQRPQRGQMG